MLWRKFPTPSCNFPDAIPITPDNSQTPPRQLRDNFETPSRHLLDNSQTTSRTFQTPSRHILNIFQTPSRHSPDICRQLADTFRHLADTLQTPCRQIQTPSRQPQDNLQASSTRLHDQMSKPEIEFHVMEEMYSALHMWSAHVQKRQFLGKDSDYGTQSHAAEPYSCLQVWVNWWVGSWLDGWLGGNQDENNATLWSNLQDCQISLKFPSLTRVWQKNIIQWTIVKI